MSHGMEEQGHHHLLECPGGAMSSCSQGPPAFNVLYRAVLCCAVDVRGHWTGKDPGGDGGGLGWALSHALLLALGAWAPR